MNPIMLHSFTRRMSDISVVHVSMRVALKRDGEMGSMEWTQLHTSVVFINNFMCNY